jgi:F-type H+-transporting ATPase subunit a
MFASPLEQFTLITIFPIFVPFTNYYLSFTTSSFYMMVSTGFFLYALLCLLTPAGGFLIPTRWQSVAEMYYDFIVGMVKEQIGKPGRKYFPFIFSIFTFVLLNNVIGLIPYTLTPTSHFVITMTLSCTIFIGVTIIGVVKHKHRFLGFFLPPGAPIQLAPFLVVIEMISYFFRAISLGVRLFANMLSGHCLVKILAGFAWTMLQLGGGMVYAAIPLLIVVVAVFFLEIGVAFLQSYVFTILTCIYFKDAIELH